MKRSRWPLFRVTLQSKGGLLLLVILGCARRGSGIALIACSAYLVSTAAFYPSLADLRMPIIELSILSLVHGLCYYLERYTSHDMTLRLLVYLRTWFFQALEHLSPIRLLKRHKRRTISSTTGDLLHQVSADLKTLQHFPAQVLAPTLIALGIIWAMWLFLSQFQLLFALTLLSFSALVSIGLPLLTTLLNRTPEQRNRAVQYKLRRNAIDMLQGLPEIIAFGRERDQRIWIEKLSSELTEAQARLARNHGLYQALGEMCANLALWTIVLLAIPAISQGAMDGPQLAMIGLATLASISGLLPLSTSAYALKGSIVASHQLTEVIDTYPAAGPLKLSPDPCSYDLTIRNLSFRYAEEEPDVLQHISLSISQGQCIALVGPGGAGKSTLAHLLLRFWEYQEGQMWLGGHPLQEYYQEDLLKLISVISQETHLFSTTLRENLLLAKPHASQQELEWAAREAHIHEAILALPYGYDTLIGEQGCSLSAGERQQLAIARAFLKSTPIILLDEATSHLDLTTERALRDPLRQLIKGKTTLLLTHRLAGLDIADEILVIDQGRIKERGTHHDLLQQEGLYWRLARLQSPGLT